MSKDKFEITIPRTQFVLKSNTMYKILPKSDASAPDGFKDNGTTKVISPDVGNTVYPPWDNEMKVWDTCFYKASRSLRGMPEAEKEEYLKKVQEFIVKPVEELKGEGILSHQESNKFFDDFGSTLKANRVVNTSEPLERLALYFAVLNNDLAPKEHASNPLYSKAQYVIVNSEEAVNIRQEREMEKNQAIGLFYVLQNNDKEKMSDLLDYLGIANTSTTDKATLNSAFNRWLTDKTSGFQNSNLFIKTYEKFDSEDGAEELYLYQKLKELNDKNLIKLQRGEVFLEGKPIGAGFKLAASYLMTNKDDKEKVAKLIEQIQE